MHEFEELENVVLTAISGMEQLGVMTIAPYSGELEIDDLKQITARFPCIYVISDGLEIDWSVGSDLCQISFTLIVGDKGYRGGNVTARGTSEQIGVYSILREIRNRLHRKPLLSGWSPATVVAENPEVYLPKIGLCLYSARYIIKAIKKL